jgi:prolyl oligopeptidase
MQRPCRASLALSICAAALPVVAPAAVKAAVAETTVADPYLWLEEISGREALQWVRGQNERTAAALTRTQEFRELETGMRSILDSDARIPTLTKIGPYYYNFWNDATHERGVFRRTMLAEYRRPRPKWEIVLDIDALNAAERENWVWRGIDCLRPQYRRCLIELSRGGADASVTREFDLESRQWVAKGFYRPEAKGQLSWIDIDTVLVSTDFGPGSMTSSGLSRIVKQWKRGTPLAAASTVYEGDRNDMIVYAEHDDAPGYARDLIFHHVARYRQKLILRSGDGQLTSIDLPDSALKELHREWLLVTLRDPWKVDGRVYEAGSLLAVRLEDFLKGKRAFDLLFEPAPNTSLASSVWTRTHLVLNVIEDVKSRLSVLTPTASGWKRSEMLGVPAIATLTVEPVDEDESDAIWLTAADFLKPPTLYLADIGRAPEPLKSAPAFFDSTRYVTEQQFATSKDGTSIPYFLIGPRDLKHDGTTPTLLSGYGGFEVPLLPAYTATLGRCWLEKGGVAAIANIRGGGEYGPRWHQAALKERRHKAYEDFAAVARHLIARKITSPKHLGAQGGSNGGLLAGNMLTQYPDLFAAIVMQAPLLDMKRYSHLLAGASWIEEYGDPDKAEEWAYVRNFSPYHLFDPSRQYPPALFMTSTRDDRVHPGHARKMAARMIDADKRVVYYENIEGGHGGSATNAQAAYKTALSCTFLWHELSKH